MTPETVVDRQLVYTGRKIQVAVEEITTPEGRSVRRDVVIHPGAVVILPIIDACHVVLLRNYRFIVQETLWEVPAGTLEAGEEPQAAAIRELAEETGYRAARWRYHGFVYASPGVLTEKMHLFFALDLTPGPAQPEAGEHLQAVTLPLTQALDMVRRGEIHDAKTVAALLLWDRFYATELTPSNLTARA
ncbi:MAG: NUDIX hydrolase [Gemmataceae bacterium]|nr:NUDIX hydrolase [Gemmataceae bacterium]MCS7271704.1 NUDIX hydrolase [Gemmataceae bacterium]MDW8244182.1 NUDIX hydrolase [Thermogemmata sp.]